MAERPDTLTVLLAGGGSGGHIYPGLAIAERLRDLAPDVQCRFLCSTRSIDTAILSQATIGDAGVDFTPIPAEPFSARPGRFARFIRGYGRSRALTRRLIARHHPCHVIALGGFVAAPAAAAAAAESSPATLVNLDATPGKANRRTARKCDLVVSAVATPERPTFATRIVGMPLRRASIASQPGPDCRAALGLDRDLRTLLVVGGSQGAKSVNDFLAALIQGHTSALDGWQVLHLTGGETSQRVMKAAYAEAGIPARVCAFLNDMGRAWGAADLAVSRSGAGSVGEAIANGVPALFLPYPFHRDEHQRRNAEPLESAGGCVVVRDRVDAHANVVDAGTHLRALLSDDARRARMREAVTATACDDAAATIAGLVLDRGGHHRA
ncbi:MAG: UDP-N-acetylglucosamine--N-acetylmuramyl-(pentapeptide) pyrophosphoryl-undecaprenol N-acetylglucosamine transferase [Planctomycetota bacterium]|jgi:UDP-N-acetylglucosamine--N-acetylmuramyl-(pentapeptide) pyrophosphoryl-undecaprenol N-acetylglucosamine transferase